MRGTAVLRFAPVSIVIYKTRHSICSLRDVVYERHAVLLKFRFSPIFRR